MIIYILIVPLLAFYTNVTLEFTLSKVAPGKGH